MRDRCICSYLAKNMLNTRDIDTRNPTIIKGLEKNLHQTNIVASCGDENARFAFAKHHSTPYRTVEKHRKKPRFIAKPCY